MMRLLLYRFCNQPPFSSLFPGSQNCGGGESDQREEENAMEVAIILLLLYQAIPQPSPGTYMFTQDGTSIVRMDTRTGLMERCSLVGNTLTCRQVVAGEVETVSAK